jgi:hypothetical protein
MKRCPYCEANLQAKIPSPKDIEIAKTSAGGWNMETLRDWGISWPPQKGWRVRLLKIWENKR